MLGPSKWTWSHRDHKLVGGYQQTLPWALSELALVFCTAFIFVLNQTFPDAFMGVFTVGLMTLSWITYIAARCSSLVSRRWILKSWGITTDGLFIGALLPLVTLLAALPWSGGFAFGSWHAVATLVAVQCLRQFLLFPMFTRNVEFLVLSLGGAQVPWRWAHYVCIVGCVAGSLWFVTGEFSILDQPMIASYLVSHNIVPIVLVRSLLLFRS